MLAITLFLAASGVVTAAVSASLQAAAKIKRDVMAADLAQSLISQIQSRSRAAKNVQPTACKNPLYKGWTWEVFVETLEPVNEQAPAMDRVTVTVAMPASNYRFSLTQLMLTAEDQDAADEEDTSGETPLPSPAPPEPT